MGASAWSGCHPVPAVGRALLGMWSHALGAFRIRNSREDRPAPHPMVLYAALCVAMVQGPVIACFFWAANVARHEWLVMTPFMSLLALPTVLVSLAVAKPLPARQQRVHNGHVVAALLGSLAMLTWLPHRLVGL